MNPKLQPWEKYPEIWKDEKAFLTYLRGAFRAIWSKYPAKLKWKQQQGIKPPASYKGRAKKLVQCKQCNEWFPISNTEVDHIVEGGSFKSVAESFEWFLRIIDVNDNWQILCKPCHKVKSLAVRKNISIEDAIIDKKVIEFSKKSTNEQKSILTEILDERIITSLKNASDRKRAYHEWLKEEK